MKKDQLVKRRVAMGAAAVVAGALGAGGLASSADAAQPLKPSLTAMRRPMSKSLTVHATPGQIEAQAAALRASDPEKSAILTAAVNAARQRPGFSPNNAISINFALKWDVASPVAGEAMRP